MSCNGNNHDVFCPCEFRGGHGKGGVPSRSLLVKDISYSSLAGSKYESYLDVNATCPVCHKAVIFYRSPFDGRVFFDPPPGYPWPKHPCTDSRKKVAKSTLPDKSLLAGSGWDWLLFSESQPVIEVDWEFEVLEGAKTASGWHDLSLVPKSRRVVGFDISGRLLILRQKRSIKVIRKNPPTGPAFRNLDYEINDSYQLTLRVDGHDESLKKKVGSLKNCVISAKLTGKEGCTLSCLPLTENAPARFELETKVIRIKRLKG